MSQKHNIAQDEIEKIMETVILSKEVTAEMWSEK